ncbi:MAG TPA: hypothetical protein VK731_05685 [Candidatus Cybelea sp.]|nr:hypothetical protein [Candidatus Cybelea sp.]
MKSRLKIIIVTFVATTTFWCLVIVGLFWWSSHSGTAAANSVEDSASRGYLSLMRAWNDGKQPVKFTVEEFRTNTPGSNSSPVVLLERQLPPSGDLWIGIKKDEPSGK